MSLRGVPPSCFRKKAGGTTWQSDTFTEPVLSESEGFSVNSVVARADGIGSWQSAKRRELAFGKRGDLNEIASLTLAMTLCVILVVVASGLDGDASLQNRPSIFSSFLPEFYSWATSPLPPI